MMLQRLEQLARHSLDKVRSGFGSDRGPERGLQRGQERGMGRVATPPRHPTGPPAQQRTPMRLAMAHLVQDPSKALQVESRPFLPDSDLQGMEILRELIDFCAERPNMSTAQLLELWREHPAQKHLQTLATWSMQGEEEHLIQEFRDSLSGLELEWIEVQIRKLPPSTTDMSQDEYRRWTGLLEKKQEIQKARSGSQ